MSTDCFVNKTNIIYILRENGGPIFTRTNNNLVNST